MHGRSRPVRGGCAPNPYLSAHDHPSVSIKMNILTLHLARRFHWLQLPAVVLITLLQRTPVLRVLASAESACISSPLGQVLRSSLACW